MTDKLLDRINEQILTNKPLCYIGLAGENVVLGTTTEPLTTFKEFKGTNTELLKLILIIQEMALNGAGFTEIKQFVGSALTDENVDLIIDVTTDGLR